jgi:hypothetical protein
MKKLTMDQEAHYQIKFPGELPTVWLQWEGRLEINITQAEHVPSMTTLTAKLDQAALMGQLRRLYSLGVPLLSVECIDIKSATDCWT